jgi:TP901 family phage tail tape measure protein
MATNLRVGVTIGAALGSGFRRAFGSARSTVSQLGRTADDLGRRHDRLGSVMSRALSMPSRAVAALRRQYDGLGQAVDRLRAKHERLAAAGQARGRALSEARANLRGDAMEAAGEALAVGAPVVASVGTAMRFQDSVRDIAITGGFDAQEEAAVGQAARAASRQFNQTTEAVLQGMAVLTAGGMDNAQALAAYAPILAKTATATRASMDDLGAVAVSLRDSLGVTESGFEGALNMLAYAGKRGQFELADMAKWLPQLAPMYDAMGVSGAEAVAEIGAALQVARKGAGSNDEAANNFKNFLSKLFAPETLKSFADAGIDIKQSMMSLRSQGFTPMQAMLETITLYLGKKGPEAASAFTKAREAALARLNEAYKLGELFTDMQVMSFIRPAIANRDEMADIQRGAEAAASEGGLDADFAARMEVATEKAKRFRGELNLLGIGVGTALLPALGSLLDVVTPVLSAVTDWVSAHPNLVAGVVGVVTALVTAKVAMLGFRFGALLLASPVVSLFTRFNQLAAGVLRLRTVAQAGIFTRLIGRLGAVGRGAWVATRWLAVSLFGGVMRAGMGALGLARVLGGTLLRGLTLAGRAVLFLGRALLMNPIGLAVTAIAAGAYLIYRHWDTLGPWFRNLWGGIKSAFGSALAGIRSAWSGITGWFGGLWQELKAGVSGGLGGIGQLIVNFSPLGLFYRAFAGVMSWFGIDLPKRFSEFGGNLIGGLVEGIKNKLAAAKETIVGFGSNVKGWFANTLGIKSPSRVFAGFGDNISQGVAMGMQRSQGLATGSAAALALATTTAFGQPALPQPLAVNMANQAQQVRQQLKPAAVPALATQTQLIRQRLQPAGRPEVAERTALAQRLTTAQRQQTAPAGQGGQGATITFAPTITVTGARDTAAVREQVSEATRLSFVEFERMMRRYESEQRRRRYGDI